MSAFEQVDRWRGLRKCGHDFRRILRQLRASPLRSRLLLVLVPAAVLIICGFLVFLIAGSIHGRPRLADVPSHWQKLTVSEVLLQRPPSASRHEKRLEANAVTFDIDVSVAVHVGGNAYEVPLPNHIIADVLGIDTVEANALQQRGDIIEPRWRLSTLQLFDPITRRPLGPAHANHEYISERGSGAFSHWRTNDGDAFLRFSTTDGKQPSGAYHAVIYSLAPRLGWFEVRPYHAMQRQEVFRHLYLQSFVAAGIYEPHLMDRPSEARHGHCYFWRIQASEFHDGKLQGAALSQMLSSLGKEVELRARLSPPANSLAIYQNKVALHALFHEHDVRTPATAVFATEAEALADSGSLNFPVIIKDPYGFSSTGIRQSKTLAEFPSQIREFFRHAPAKTEAIVQQKVHATREARITYVNGRPFHGYWRIRQSESSASAASTQGGRQSFDFPLRKVARFIQGFANLTKVPVGGVDIIWDESIVNLPESEVESSEMPEPYVLEVSPIFDVNPPTPKTWTGTYAAFKKKDGFQAAYWQARQRYVDAMVIAEVERYRSSRRTLFIDIDNVCAQSAKRLRRWASGVRGNGPVDARAFSAKEVSRDEVVNGSVEALLALRRKFFIRFLSSRGSYENAFATTQEWLVRNGFEYDDLLVVNKPQDKLAHLWNESLLIDDLTAKHESEDGPVPQREMIDQLTRNQLPFELFDAQTNNWQHISDRLLAGTEAPKFCVYSANVGGYDRVAPLPHADQLKGLEFFVFVESGKHRDWPADGWTPWPVEKVGTWGYKVASRIPKIHAHAYAVLRQCKVTLYMDANVKLKGSPRELMEQFLASDADIGLYTISRSFQEEMRWLSVTKFATEEVLTEQVDRYKKDGFSGDNVYYGKIILRRMNVQRVEEFESTWFNEYVHGVVRRDQLSLPYALWRHDLRLHNLGVASKMKDWNKPWEADFLPAFTQWFEWFKNHKKGRGAAAPKSVAGVGIAVVVFAMS